MKVTQTSLRRKYDVQVLFYIYKVDLYIVFIPLQMRFGVGYIVVTLLVGFFVGCLVGLCSVHV